LIGAICYSVSSEAVGARNLIDATIDYQFVSQKLFRDMFGAFREGSDAKTTAMLGQRHSIMLQRIFQYFIPIASQWQF
jgi:hypothetical protein